MRRKIEFEDESTKCCSSLNEQLSPDFWNIFEQWCDSSRILNEASIKAMHKFLLIIETFYKWTAEKTLYEWSVNRNQLRGTVLSLQQTSVL